MSEKTRKTLMEILAGKIDGLDVLVEMIKEGKEEERKERPDTLGNIIQSVIPLFIMTQIMPLLQQGFGQTLRETTVNVKVESASSIIPIDISAQSAIIAVDIRAQTVTLNIRIVESTVTLNVNITGSTTVLDVNITGSTVLNVNITGSTTVLNVAVQGNASVVISGQVVDVKMSGFYHAVAGLGKRLVGHGINYFGQNILINYTVPSGKRFVITNIKLAGTLSSFVGAWITRYPTTGWTMYYEYKPDHMEVYVKVNDVTIYTSAINVSTPCVAESLPTPIVVHGGQVVKVIVYTNIPGSALYVEVNGYEETVS